MRIAPVRIMAALTVLLLLCVGVLATGCRVKTSSTESKGETEPPAREDVEVPEDDETDHDVSEMEEDTEALWPAPVREDESI